MPRAVLKDGNILCLKYMSIYGFSKILFGGKFPPAVKKPKQNIVNHWFTWSVGTSYELGADWVVIF